MVGRGTPAGGRRSDSSADRAGPGVRGAGDADRAVPGGPAQLIHFDRVLSPAEVDEIRRGDRCVYCGRRTRDRTSFVIMGLLAIATIASAAALILFLGCSCT
jgi:hypothetical protein